MQSKAKQEHTKTVSKALTAIPTTFNTSSLTTNDNDNNNDSRSLLSRSLQSNNSPRGTKNETDTATWTGHQSIISNTSTFDHCQ